MKRLAKALLLTFAAFLTSVSARAEDTLERIRRTGTINIGYRENELPFSFIHDNKATGYATDVCLAVVERMRPLLGGDDVRIDFRLVTAAARFVMVGAGRVDLDCGATVMTPQRRKLAEFSYPIFIGSTRFVARRQDGLTKLDDLAGRSVVSTTGTNHFDLLSTLNRQRQLNISIVLGRTLNESFELFRSGRVSAYVTDDVILSLLVSSMPDPDAYVISGDSLNTPVPYSVIMAPGDLSFKAMFNRAFLDLAASGELERIYDRWFMRPALPNGRNLRLPMSSALRTALAALPQEP